uniref:Synergin gamma n=1 Tax=Cacopsylla melanoneura TaxID=428564 RepID=A0A8D8XPC4_9HEMI
MGDKTSTGDTKNKFDQVRIITNPLSSNKPLDADGMIENIMSKKQVFVKKSPNSYPPWLTPGSSKFPPLYSEVWKAVECPANPGFCNTPILSQILMSSGVTTQTLGYIWGLVNKKYIGVLTEEELYFTLALIAVSQNGTVVRNLDILKEVQEAMNPRLDLNIINHYQTLKRYPQPVNPLLSTTQSLSGNNLMHSNSLSFANTSVVSTLSYSEPHTLCQGPLGQNVASGGFQNSNTEQLLNATGQSEARNNIEIQNISSIVQQQSGARPKTFSWNDEDDDEFTDFQSVATPAVAAHAPNVSITLNPIHYLMASQPSEPNLNNRIQTKNTAISSNLTSTKVNNAVIPPSLTTSKVGVKEDISTVVDDDDFTEFQSSLDFDVEIKQPNILQNIKTIMDVKPQPSRDSQKMTQEMLFNDHVASVLVENVPQKTKLEVLDTMSDERNTTMYTTNTRDYSALKNLNAELTGGLFEPDISSTIIEHIIHNPADVKNSSQQTLAFKDDFDITSTKKQDDLIFEEDVFQSLNVEDSKPTIASVTNNNNNMLVPLSNEGDDDDFTDFKAAVPTKQNMDSNLFSNSIVVDTKNKSSDLEILGNLFNSQLQVNDANKIENSPTYLFTVDKNDHSELSNHQNNITSSFLGNDYEDEFDDFVQVPIVPSSQKTYNEDLFKTTTEDLKQVFQPKVEEEDEFTEFEQAPKVFIDTGKMDLHHMTPHIDAVRRDNASSPTINKSDNDWKEYGQDLNEQQTSKESNDKEDRYSALRVLEFLDEDTEEKDLSDGDTLSQDRDTSDGDNLSLQLPYVGTHDQDNIQTKCYEACIYTLETSLNLFLSNQIEKAILDHPKFTHHLKCLTEVYLVGKRLQKSGLINNGGSLKLDSTWNALSVYFSDATSFESSSSSYQNDLQDSRADNSTGERCEICLCDDSNLSLVEENHVKYHPQCINLYLNCVEPTLPIPVQ